MLGSLWRSRARLLSAGVSLALAIPGAAGGAALPDGRGYELVSPPDKLGGEVMAESSRTHASAGETLGLPAAVAFTSLAGFSDVRGTGLATEYMAERTSAPGTTGWATHAITPAQDPLTPFSVSRAMEPGYDGDMSSDLTHAVFRSWSPVTDAPNVAQVENLYVREDLRSSGAGQYRLVTDAVAPIPAPPLAFTIPLPALAGTSTEFGSVLFESSLNLTSDATGAALKLYLTDGGGTHLLAPIVGCPGGGGGGPCSAAGRVASRGSYTPHVLSDDGTRAVITAPVTANGAPVTRPGAVNKLFEFDDHGTTATEDDATVQVNASEKSTPDQAQPAVYQTASADGSRVFFESTEQLTDTPGHGLYMWERQPGDEEQALTVDASGGSFTLTFARQSSTGSGVLTSGSSTVTSVTGSFAVGDTVSGDGIPPGTTVTEMGAFTNARNSRLTLSAPATGSGASVLKGAAEATTGPLPYDATAAQVQGALEQLPGIGVGNVSVTGGPGSAGGGAPYAIAFTGALHGVDVAELRADASSLTGGAATASVAVTRPLRNLTLIVPLGVSLAEGVIGASRDGHRLYFTATAGEGQLVAGAPPVADGAIYYWQDADGAPGGTVSFVGGIPQNDIDTLIPGAFASASPSLARVTPDGRELAFETSDGSALAPRYDQTACVGRGDNPNQNPSGGCSEVYVYRADGSAPASPGIVCASCLPSGAPATSDAFVNVRTGASATTATKHLSHALSDDGRRVLFSTTEALVPEDINGKFDVYEYDVPSGTVHLISSGRGTSDSYFLDASADGHDVYFVTRERLVGWDRDSAYDLYDARVDGGFPDPPTPSAECAGDACQGQAPAMPGGAALGSSAFHGAGDLAERFARPAPKHPRCTRGQVRRRVRAKVRCVRRRKASHGKRRATAKRRTK